MTKPPSHWPYSLLGLIAAAAIAAWSVSAAKPPSPVSAGASAELFSAERAFDHVRELARAPRPVGVAAHTAARDYLVAELRELGLSPEVQDEKMVLRQSADRFRAVRIRNVVARLPGRDSTGALLLAAHYDSKPNTPGAGDALAGVAAILECLRALAAGPQLDNDLIVLLSDAEELGLVGARAFVERHRWAADVRLVLNLEGRGSGGPAMMFETRAGNLDLMRAFARAVPHPSASSLSYEVYRRMPNDTDFSVFRDAGVQGLNVAFLARHPAYHTMLDSAESLDPGTLQHHGSHAVGVARHFGGVDLGGLAGADGADAVYFNPYPWRLIVYPATWALPLSGVVTLVLLVAIWLSWRRRRLELAGLGRGLVLFGVTVGVGALLGFCFWWLIRNYIPKMLYGPHGLAYGAGWLVVSLVALVAGAAGALAAWQGEGRRPLELWAGCWLAWSLAGLAIALFIPGASYLTVWPLLGGAIGLSVLGLPARNGGFARSEPLIMVGSAAATLLLLTPMVWTVALALTLGAAAAIGAAAGLAITSVAPVLGNLHSASGGKSSSLLFVAGVAGLIWTAVGAEPSAREPAVDTLAYGLDAESGEAWWASFDDQPDRWTSLRLGAEPERGPAPPAFGLPDAEVLYAPAEPVTLLAPSAATLSDSRASGRRVVGVVRSMRGAQLLRVRAEASVPYLAVSIEDERFEFTGDPEAEGLGEITVVAIGFDEGGLRLAFEMVEPWPVELDLTDLSWSFDALPAPPEPRPAELIPSSSWGTDAVYVRGSSLL